jgi:hypothetical protein
VAAFQSRSLTPLARTTITTTMQIYSIIKSLIHIHVFVLERQA